jgi:hypothetical protein
LNPRFSLFSQGAVIGAFFFCGHPASYAIFTSLSHADDNLISLPMQIDGMKLKHFIPIVAAGIILSVSVYMTLLAAGPVIPDPLRPTAENAVSEDPTIAAPAIANLRAKGPAGLEALLAAHAKLIREHDKNLAISSSPSQQAAWKRLQSALDAVSAQRDCSASHLYWYTNFDEAKAAAKAGGKPILSLRLLGRLDEEYSCANSRFFRTTLYANAAVAQYLRDHFILHWKSVRPVPHITIDFGDGRKIERTITGNSIHYILDTDGRPIDALPGLYGPKAFLKGLADAETATLKSTRLAGNEKTQYLRQYHNERIKEIQNSWRKDMLALGQPATVRTSNSMFTPGDAPSTALAAAPLAASKFAVERPMLKSFQTADDTTWSRVASLHANDAALDTASTVLIRSKNPTAAEAGLVALTKWQAESPLTATLRNLERSIAEDTVRNEYLLHSQIHEWFVNGAAPQDIDGLNSMVYAKLFLTPDSDPWLGLAPANTFTGLDNNGLVQASRAR